MRNRNIVSVIAGGFLLAAASGLPAQSLEALLHKQEGRSMRASSGNIEKNADAWHLESGETRTIAVLKGPGKITHFWLIGNSMDIRYPRALVLRIYWDGAENPSVETPFGDFFAVGNGMRAVVNTLPIEVSSYGRGYNCYWEMPFREQARITVSNDSPTHQASLFFQIDWRRLNQAPGDMMYFHARYHQEYPPEMGKPYTVFKGEGRGHYVGTVLSSQNAIGHWYGEGDDFFYIDGEERPSIFGTGTEDYFNDAWNMRVHHGLHTGCTVFEPRAPDARVTAYRWHIADPVLFDESLRFDIERTGIIMNSAGDVVLNWGYRPDYWSSVSYWYQEDVAEPWCEFPPYGERVNPEIVLHLPEAVESMTHSPGIELQVNPYNRATWTKPWFRVANERIGEWVEIPFEIKRKGRYSMSLFQHLREDNGIWKVYIDGREIYEAGESQIAGGYRVSLVNKRPPERINTTLDFFNIFRKNEHEDYIYGQNRERKIGLFEFEPGPHRIRLVCVGSNPQSFDPLTGQPGRNLSADILSLRRLPFENMDAWIEKMLELTGQKKK